MGLSSRPSPKYFDPIKNEAVEDRVARAEDWFVDSLEAWRHAGGYDKMTLVGHSLGQSTVSPSSTFPRAYLSV